MAKKMVSKAAPGVSPNPSAAPGAAPAQTAGFDTRELGISGVIRYGAISRVYEEFLRELQGPQGMKLYREAIDNDPIIGAVLFAIQYLCRSVTFRIEPSVTAVDSVRALAVAARVKGALFDDLEVPWPDQLSEILTMAPYGWALHEIVFKKCAGGSPDGVYGGQPLSPGGPTGQGIVPPTFAPSRFNDGFIGWRSWGLRAQDTLFMWEWDAQSRAVAMQQMAPPDYRIRRIPVAKCLLFRTQIAKQNPEGRSIIRNAIPSYLIKKNLQIVEAMGIERDLAGYPVITTVEPNIANGVMPPDLWNPNDTAMVSLLASIQKMVKAVRRDEQEGMVLPWWLKFSLITSGGSRAFDTSKIISRYDKNMAISVLADFIMLGHESVGSKALASTKASIFTAALSALLDSICAVINRFAIPQLLRINGIPAEYAPTLNHGNPENIPLEALGGYIKSLAVAGMPLFPNMELQEALLQAAKMPTAGVARTPAQNALMGDDEGRMEDPAGSERAMSQQEREERQAQLAAEQSAEQDAEQSEEVDADEERRQLEDSPVD